MTERAKDFLKAVSSEEKYSKEVAKFKDFSEEEFWDFIDSSSKELGMEVTREDFEQSGELSEDELAGVAGGADVCACVLAGGGPASDVRGGLAPCGCVIGGSGEGVSIYARCVCVIGGGGN